MTIEQVLVAKLEPHSKRIKDGEGNDFDYLPAVLLQLLEEQKRHSQQLDEIAKFLDSIKSTAASTAAMSKTQIAAYENSTKAKLEQLEATTKDLKTQIENSKSLLGNQIVEVASAHADFANKANEGLTAIDSKLESLSASNRESQVKCLRILIAGLVTSTVIIGLAIAILQRL